MGKTTNKTTNASRWGIVCTVLAPPETLGDFLAYHLDLGASEIHVFLDDDSPENLAAFGDTDRVYIHKTHDGFWERHKRGYRPEKHQTRQAWAANWLYHHHPLELDWITHIDVDEFLCPQGDIGQILAKAEPHENWLRIRPAEALVYEGAEGLDPDTTYAKAYSPHRPKDNFIFDDIYPTFWRYLRSGFLSHLQGKLFFRTNQNRQIIDIHITARRGIPIPPDRVLDEIELCHLHYPSRKIWSEKVPFRMERGSYIAADPDKLKAEAFDLNLHHLFSILSAKDSEVTLDDFFDEVCLASPKLIEKLRDHNLLKTFQLDTQNKRRAYFPEL